MIDNGHEEIKTEAPQFPDLHLNIKVEEGGKISVEGCIREEIFALGLLEKAADIIKQHNKPIIQQPVKGGFRFMGRK